MRFKLFLPGIFWFIFSVVLLSLPGDDLPQTGFFNFPYFDKYVHFAMFAILTALFCYPFSFLKDRDREKKLLTVVFVLVVLYGIAMEFVQKYLVAGRSFDIVDIVFDTAGTIGGLAVVSMFVSKKIGPNRHRGRNQN